MSSGVYAPFEGELSLYGKLELMGPEVAKVKDQEPCLLSSGGALWRF